MYDVINSKSIKVNEIQKDNNKIICKTDVSEIIYTFTNKTIDIDVNFYDNIHQYIFLFKAGSNEVIAGKVPYAEWRFYPNCNDLIFVKGMNGLKTQGNCCAYGSWEGRELIVMNKENNHLSLEPVSLTTEQRELIDNRAYNLPNEDVYLYSPKEYEVFQRYSREKGFVNLSGKVSEKITKLYYRIEGKNYKGNKYSSGWKEIELANSNFDIRLNVPSGGWYKLELKAHDKIVKVIEKFGVGEIIVSSGQSNSTNCGQFYTKTETGMVASPNGTEWKIGDDPQIGPADSYYGGGSLHPALGDVLYKEFKVPIGIAAIGCAGATINLFAQGQWVYDYNRTRINRMGKNGFRALIWIQGETDVASKMPSDEYKLKLENLLNNLRKEVCWNFPCFVAKVSYLNDQERAYEPMRVAQENVIKEGYAFRGVDMDTIGPEYRDVNHKGVHMIPEGLKKHGQMWADILIPFIHSEID